MNIPILQDKSLQDTLKQKGWVSFPYLNKEEVSVLKSFYFDKTSSKNLNGFHATMFHADLHYKQEVDSIIKKVISHNFDQIFLSNFHQLYANFMVKEQGQESDMKWHQDWAYVHENQSDSYAIWIPLVDLNAQNGAFTVAEESHKLENYVRGPGVDDQFIEKKWLNEKFKIKPLYLKAGEAVVWHHRLLHASPPNLTDIPRIAVTAILKEKNAENIYFYKQQNEKFVREYSVAPNFYLQNKIDALPQSKLNKKLFYDFDSVLNKQQFDSFELKNRIKKLFRF